MEGKWKCKNNNGEGRRFTAIFGDKEVSRPAHKRPKGKNVERGN